MSFYDDDDFDSYRVYRSKRKVGKPMGHGAPHYPNKNERKELVRIMRASGMTEEQVRKNVDHRRLLAEAAKRGVTTTRDQQYHRVLHELKQIRRNLAYYADLPSWHPDVMKRMLEHQTVKDRGLQRVVMSMFTQQK